MYVLYNRDLELACDESVVRLLGEASKKDYSLMLINMEAKKSGLEPFCNNFSKNAIEERITAIQDVSEMVMREAEASEYDSPYIGTIESTVSKGKIPNVELQSNFGSIGSEVIFNH